MGDWLGLQGRRALVVGAGGFGTACSRELVRCGAEVYLADRDEEQLAAVEEPAVRTGVWDVVEPGVAEHLVAAAVTTLGGLDLMIHAAGTNDRRPVLDPELEDWQLLLDVNLMSAFTLGRAAGRRMVEQGHGRIVFFSSVSGLLAHPHHAPYAASKGAMNMLAKVMAVEWADKGVTVNAVAPGFIDSDMTAGLPDELKHTFLQRIAAGRFGTPEEVAAAVVFLASGDASYINGQTLTVDGGMVLN